MRFLGFPEMYYNRLFEEFRGSCRILAARSPWEAKTENLGMSTFRVLYECGRNLVGNVRSLVCFSDFLPFLKVL